MLHYNCIYVHELIVNANMLGSSAIKIKIMPARYHCVTCMGCTFVETVFSTAHPGKIEANRKVAVALGAFVRKSYLI